MYRGSGISAFHRLRIDRRGAILPLAAVTALIMFLLAGLAIDVALIMSAKNRVRRAMDAAGIAIATNFRDNDTATQAEVENFAIQWVQSNYPDYKIGEYFDLNVGWSDGVADLSAKVRVDTLFMDVVGATEIEADVGVRVISETRGLEVAIAIDNSGSMNGTQLNWAIGSVRRFIDVLYDNAPDASQVRVGYVPFTSAVNIKHPTNFYAEWVDGDSEDLPYLDDNTTALPPEVPYHGDYYVPRVSHAYLYKLAANASSKSHWYDMWKGCVEARSITYNGKEMDVTDEAPNPAIPQTLFVPYLWPDGPDLGGNLGSTDSSDKMITSCVESQTPCWVDDGNYETPNNYLNDQVDASFTWSQRLESIAAWLDPAEVANVDLNRDETGPTTFGPSMACPEPVLPLTSSREDLKTVIGKTGQGGTMQFFHQGGTSFAEGLMWAWRLLSKNPPFTEGAAYKNGDGTENRKVDKVIILFIDAGAGGNGLIAAKNPRHSTYSAHGFAEPYGRLDPLDTNDLDTKTLKACLNARAPVENGFKEKIVIYAVGYDYNGAKDESLIGILEQCTGDPDRVFIAKDTTQLYQIFESLAQQLTKLRVVY